jgi:hypothetical protein
MALPGFSDGLDPGWWRIAQATPPIFTLVGTLDGSTANIAVASPFASPSNPPPVVGQQVSGAGIPAPSTVVSVSSSSFVISANTTVAGAQTLTIGAEPVSVQEAMAWGIIENPDTTGLVADLIQAAREMAEADIKRAFMLQAKTLYCMAFPWSGYYSLAIRGQGLNPWWFPLAQGIIQLPYPMLQAVTSVRYLDTNGTLQTIDPSGYVVTNNATPGRLQPAYGTVWPVARPQIDAVQITFTCGYGAFSSNVPASTRLAMRSLVSAGYGQRDSFAACGELNPTPLYEKLLQVEDYGGYF